jgi:hypothetical protein
MTSYFRRPCLIFVTFCNRLREGNYQEFDHPVCLFAFIHSLNINIMFYLSGGRGLSLSVPNVETQEDYNKDKKSEL